MTATRWWVVIFLVAAPAALAGCASDGSARNRGKIEIGDGESFDGLLEVTNSSASAAWVRRDFDLSGYSRVRLEGAGIEYRPVRSGSRRLGSANEGFPVSPSAQARLVDVMRKAFEQELARSKRFALTEEIGPGVLTVWAGLLDVVSFAPPQRAGRNDIFLRRLGEATLVIELRDSESNATLARVMDRRALENMTRGGTHSNAVNNFADVQKLATSWARLLRQRLDESPTLSHAAEPLPASK